MILALSHSIQATCLALTMPQLLADDRVSLVFQGTAIGSQTVKLSDHWTGAITTFEVTRVWKGQAGKITTVNIKETIEGLPPEPGKQYLVIAAVQSARERQEWSVPPDAEPTFGANTGCNIFLIDSQMARRIIAGAPGVPPR